MTHHTRIYNLGLQSFLPLPLAARYHSAPDIVVRQGAVPRPPHQVLGDGSLFAATAEGAYVAWDGVGACLVRDGREVVVAQEGGDPTLLPLLILGPAMTLLLQQRGYTVLHGSVVAFEAGAVAFLGDSGAGKSTLAAALDGRGRKVVADDLTVVEFAGEQPYALPGPPQLRLLPDSVRALGYDPASIPIIHASMSKHGLGVAARSHGARVPLRQIYLLSEQRERVSAPLGAREAFLELARYYYLHPVALLQATGGEAQLLKCATLAERVPVRRLRRHPALAELGTLDQLIERQLASAGDCVEERRG